MKRHEAIAKLIERHLPEGYDDALDVAITQLRWQNDLLREIVQIIRDNNLCICHLDTYCEKCQPCDIGKWLAKAEEEE